MNTKAAGSMLFVRSSEDLRRALTGVNDLLSRRPSQGSRGDDVLGVVVREGVDRSLSTSTHGGVRPLAERVALRESVGLSGIWSLCCFDLTTLDAEAAPEHRRRQLVESLLASGEISRVGTDRERSRLLPVFTRAEAVHGVDWVVDDLAARYPTLAIGPECFVHDAARGRLVRLAYHQTLFGGLGIVQKILRHNIDN